MRRRDPQIRPAVQLEIEVEGGWMVAVRYDCSHAYSHMDKYDIKGNQIKKTLHLSFESALTYGDWDINKKLAKI